MALDKSVSQTIECKCTYSQAGHKQRRLLHSQQPLHGLLLPVLLSELVQGAVVPAQRSEQHLLGLFLHATVEQRLCGSKVFFFKLQVEQFYLFIFSPD